ncbi:protein of unknown function [Streptomyces sp. KY75]|nr:protein of unknown function [Streptomyces sp. KY75]
MVCGSPASSGCIWPPPVNPVNPVNLRLVNLWLRVLRSVRTRTEA